MKTGSEYANWEQYGSTDGTDDGQGFFPLGMVIKESGLENFLNTAFSNAGIKSPLTPKNRPQVGVAPPQMPPMSLPPVPAVMPQAMSSVQVNPIPERPAITAHPLYPNGYSILKGL